MKELIRSLYEKYRNMILYAFFGVAAALADYLVYSILVYTGVFDRPEICSLIGNACGFIFTFLTNTFLNFKKRDKFLQRFVSYALICCLGSLISTLLIYLFKELINVYVLKIGVMAVVCVFQYFMNKLITYRN